MYIREHVQRPCGNRVTPPSRYHYYYFLLHSIILFPMHHRRWIIIIIIPQCVAAFEFCDTNNTIVCGFFSSVTHYRDPQCGRWRRIMCQRPKKREGVQSVYAIIDFSPFFLIHINVTCQKLRLVETWNPPIPYSSYPHRCHGTYIDSRKGKKKRWKWITLTL